MEGPSTQLVDRVGDYRLDLTRLLYMLYMDLEQQLARADMKANLILTANSILLAASVNVLVTQVRVAPTNAHLLAAVASMVPALLLSALAMNYALSVAYPREGKAVVAVPGDPMAASALFSSLAIAAKTQTAYVDDFLAADLDEVKREVLKGIHAKSAILQVKFKWVRRGILATVAAFAAWLLFMAVTVWQA